MKTSFLILSAIISINTSWAQLKTTPVCPAFVVDVLDGNVNKYSPKSTLGEIKKAFPCFTESVDVSTTSSCAGVFYKDKDIYFYTDRNYIEIRQNFKGKLSMPLLGANRNSLFKTLGNPKLKDVNWDAFQTKYGILVLYYNKGGKINKLQMSTRGTESLKLCE